MHCIAALSACVALFVSAPSFASAPFFMGLGDLPGGGFNSTANGVSGDGSVVVGQGTASGSFSNRGFRWTLSARKMIDLGDLPGGTSDTNARGVSADGSVIVGDSGATGGYFAFRWTDPSAGGSGMVSIGDLPGADAFALGTATNSNGSVVVGHSSSTASGTLNAEAYRWVAPGPMAGLGDLPGGSFFSVSTGVSADGNAVCGYSSNSASGPASSVATRWTDPASGGGGLVSIGDLPGGGVGANAFGISADGNVIVGLSAGTGGVYAFRWTNPATPGGGGSGMVSIDDLPGGSEFSRANGVSGDGNTIVGQSVTDLGMEAFVWFNPASGGGGKGMFNVRELMTDLGADLTGWTLEVATAISADGLTIVGYGPNPEGNYEAWIAHLGSPAPGTPEDLDGDGDVDGFDLALLLGAWGRCPKLGECPADLDRNGLVNGFDLAILLSAWS